MADCPRHPENVGPQWIDGPPMESEEGELLVVKLLPDLAGFEHWDDPIIVQDWGTKLKTTVDPICIPLDAVRCWVRYADLWDGSRR